ncbi:ABC transporter ATP-binding protein [Fuchsiella alkaliacetigena]|uniref:ABC transporter ATP-binding protein n=1 Tax=Fuchsiella alkaliacetigena TaxID=957042 RepID=UPI00200B2AE7|nr:ABC transporter ATP-binding protein [Fuchsiella alkaliacetigena]MCK8825995.1 ABC transporter ATP-binding protein [Fuchsiella alkaliacetigena]
MIEFENVSKVYQTPAGEPFPAVKNLSLKIEEGEFATILGPSGCGKSTSLRMIAGFEEPTRGKVLVNGQEVEKPNSNRAVVFQENSALFEWKTIKENVMFGPKACGASNSEAEEIAEKNLELVGLKDFLQQYPAQLSGGMQQRVLIARALANDPDILLMDEPFGALDALTKTLLQEKLLKIWEETGQTVYFITHDVEEAVFLSQSIHVMTAQPGQIKESWQNELPYPRDLDVRKKDEFKKLKDDILKTIHNETVTAAKQKEAEIA